MAPRPKAIRVPTCSAHGCEAEDQLKKWARLPWCPAHISEAVEGQARMAVARRAAGQPLSHSDQLALDHYPDPPPSTSGPHP